MWLWLVPAVMLSQWGRQSRNSSVIASCDQGCITWGPITSCANNVLTDAGGLLLLLPANLWLIMLIKLEVNLPFKNAHPTPTEISRSTVQQGWRQRWLSLSLSLADDEAPPVMSLWFPVRKVGKCGGAECQVTLPSPRTRCSQHTPSAAFWEMLGQKLCCMFCSPQWTSFPKNLFGSSSTKMKCIRHSSMTVKAQQVD